MNEESCIYRVKRVLALCSTYLVLSRDSTYKVRLEDVPRPQWEELSRHIAWLCEALNVLKSVREVRFDTWWIVDKGDKVEVFPGKYFSEEDMGFIYRREKVDITKRECWGVRNYTEGMTVSDGWGLSEDKPTEEVQSTDTEEVSAAKERGR